MKIVMMPAAAAGAEADAAEAGPQVLEYAGPMNADGLAQLAAQAHSGALRGSSAPSADAEGGKAASAAPTLVTSAAQWDAACGSGSALCAVAFLDAAAGPPARHSAALNEAARRLVRATVFAPTSGRPPSPRSRAADSSTPPRRRRTRRCAGCGWTARRTGL